MIVLALAALAFQGCGRKPEAAPEAPVVVESVSSAVKPDSGTAQMVARLARIAEESSTRENVYLDEMQAERWEEELKRDLKPDDEAFVRYQLGLSLINGNRNEEALDQFDALEASVAKHNPGRLTTHRVSLETQRAITWLRIGEQENCVAHHTTDSCLFPIQGSGVHQATLGSRNAADILRKLALQDPGNLRVKWLLNIAEMTLGDYPDSLPPELRIPEEALKPDYDIRRFTDVSKRAGVDAFGLAGGGAVCDFNNDGLLDIMTSSWGFRDQLRLFVNQGDGTFAHRTDEAGLKGIVGGLNLVYADYNNDGHQDVFVLRGAWMARDGKHPNSLLRNNGDGTFSDVTETAGLLDYHPTQCAVWFDFDGDGWLDLFVGNESIRDEMHPCKLFRNNRDGTFADVTERAGLGVSGFVKGVASADYNNDGRPDLYVSLLGQPNLLIRNDGLGPNQSWKFSNVTDEAGVGEPIFSFPCWFWDYNNDGWEDLFVAGYRTKGVGDIAAEYFGSPHQAETPRLYRNNGKGGFEEVSRTSGLNRILFAMGVNYGDLDNDGWLDFYVGTGDPSLDSIMPNLMFRNAQGNHFQDVTASGGFGHLQKGHAVSFADYDNDGDQDVHAVMGGAYSGDGYVNALFENPGHGNSWVKLRLEGRESNRNGLGARIRVAIRDGGKSRSVFRTVSTGGSFGCNPMRQEIGLGKAASIDRLEVLWPATGRAQVFENLKANAGYLIREGADEVEAMELPGLVQAPQVDTGAAVWTTKKSAQGKTKSVWANEVLAQEHENTFVALWDDLRRQTDKYAVFEGFELEELRIGKPGAAKALSHGVIQTTLTAAEQSLKGGAILQWLADWEKQGYEIVQTEWHHSQFVPGGDGPPRSTVAMTLHVVNQKLKQRYIIEGDLEVAWTSRKGARGHFIPGVVEASGLRILQRREPTVFRHATTLKPSVGGELNQVEPVLLHDLNGDGLSEVILPSQNALHWNRGGFQFEREEIGLASAKLIRAAVIGDFNGDGRPDLITAGREGSVMLRHGNADGRFSNDGRRIFGPEADLREPMSITAGDINGDGRLDVWLAQYRPPYSDGQMPEPYYDANDGYPAYLLRNDGDSQFSEVTEAAGLGRKRYRRTFAGSFVDLDEDGDLDLLVSSDFSGSDVYFNDGKGNFTDVTRTTMDERNHFGMGHTFADFDRDGRLDFYVTGMSSTTARRLDGLGLGREEFSRHQEMRTRMGYGSRLFLAAPEKTFRQPEYGHQVSRTGWSWGCAAFDLDNDGFSEIYVANGHVSSESCKDYCTHFWTQDIYGTGRGAEGGPSEFFQTVFFDYLTPGSANGGLSWNGFEHNVLFMNDSGKGFFNGSFLMGSAFEYDARSVAADDLNGDGKADILAVEFQRLKGGRSMTSLHMLENQWRGTNHWIGVRLQDAPGVSAIGASIVVHTREGKHIARITNGDSYRAQHANTRLFGLGAIDKVEALQVRWQNGEVTEIAHPKADTYHLMAPQSR